MKDRVKNPMEAKSQIDPETIMRKQIKIFER